MCEGFLHRYVDSRMVSVEEIAGMILSAEFRGSLQPCTVEAFPLRVVHPVVEDSEIWGEKGAPEIPLPKFNTS